VFVVNKCVFFEKLKFLKMKTIKILFVLALFSVGAIVNAQQINLGKSNIKWTGNKIGGTHYGQIKIKSGSLEVSDNSIASGKFVVDMTSITNEDLDNANFNKKLVDHLKSDDFFGVEKYPESHFVVTKSTKFSGGKATVTGKLTIKGKTEVISFDVMKKGNSEYSAKIEIDRSKFDVRYGSKTFFNVIGDKAIDDIFILDVKIVI
jgi:polyisoprenoid-binding protein YceI